MVWQSTPSPLVKIRSQNMTCTRVNDEKNIHTMSMSPWASLTCDSHIGKHFDSEELQTRENYHSIKKRSLFTENASIDLANKFIRGERTSGYSEIIYALFTECKCNNTTQKVRESIYPLWKRYPDTYATYYLCCTRPYHCRTHNWSISRRFSYLVLLLALV